MGNRRILALGHVGPAFTSGGARKQPRADDGRRTIGAAQPRGAGVQAEDVTGGESPTTYQLTGEAVPSPIDEVPAPALAGRSTGRAWGRARVGGSVSPSHLQLLAVWETAEHYGIAVEVLLGRTRMARIAEARHVAMYLCRRATGASLPAIGRRFGRDHTAVLHAVRRIEQAIESGDRIGDEVLAVLQRMTNPQTDRGSGCQGGGGGDERAITRAAPADPDLDTAAPAAIGDAR